MSLEENKENSINSVERVNSVNNASSVNSVERVNSVNNASCVKSANSQNEKMENEIPIDHDENYLAELALLGFFNDFALIDIGIHDFIREVYFED